MGKLLRPLPPPLLWQSSLDEDYNTNLKDTVDVANATLEDESP
jgi:hypothetical protein